MVGGVYGGRGRGQVPTCCCLPPPAGRPPHELVLDVVVERKTAADLCHSLSDGRYREQKVGGGEMGGLGEGMGGIRALGGQWGGDAGVLWGDLGFLGEE